MMADYPIAELMQVATRADNPIVTLMRSCRTREQQLVLAQQAVDAVFYALDGECERQQDPTVQAAYESGRALGHLLRALNQRSG
jgi:Ser/Thr protein kinase RdoA (MazF antagonist)